MHCRPKCYAAGLRDYTSVVYFKLYYFDVVLYVRRSKNIATITYVSITVTVNIDSSIVEFMRLIRSGFTSNEATLTMDLSHKHK